MKEGMDDAMSVCAMIRYLVEPASVVRCDCPYFLGGHTPCTLSNASLVFSVARP
jgi:hypothetical protein